MPDQPPSPAPPAAPAAKTVAAMAAPNASAGMTLFVMIVATLYFGKEVLVPVTLALLLAFILAPLVELLRKAYLGRVPSVLLGVILALGLILAIGGVIGIQIADLGTRLPQYAAAVQTKVDTVKDFTVGRLSALADRIGGQGHHPRRRRSHNAGGAGASGTGPRGGAADRLGAAGYRRPLSRTGARAAGDVRHRLRGDDVRAAAA